MMTHRHFRTQPQTGPKVNATSPDNSGQHAAGNGDLHSLVIRSGLDAHVVAGLAKRRQLQIAIQLANIPEGRERGRVESYKRKRIVRNQVSLAEGETYPGTRALAICEALQEAALDDTVSGRRSTAGRAKRGMNARTALALVNAMAENLLAGGSAEVATDSKIGG